jgi:hypothetical protein
MRVTSGHGGPYATEPGPPRSGRVPPPGLGRGECPAPLVGVGVSTPWDGRPGPRASGEGVGYVDKVLAVLYLIGYYLNIHLYRGNQALCTSVICGVVGSVILIRHRREISHRFIEISLAIVLLSALSIVFAPMLGTYLMEHIKGLLQLGYSIVVGYSLYLVLQNTDRGDIVRMLVAFDVLIVVGCLLEAITPLSAVSDGFRQAVFPESRVYVGDDRDIGFFGLVRPKLFTSEPSHVSKFYLITSLAWFFLMKNPLRYAYFAAAMLAGMVAIRSPILLAGLAVLGILAFKGQLGILKRRSLAGIVSIPAMIVILLGLGVASITIFEERVTNMLESRDGSANFRISIPYEVAIRTMMEHPFFGVGLGAIEATEDVTIEVIGGYVTSKYQLLTYDSVAQSLTNCFCEVFIFYGLLGGAVFVLLIFSMIKYMGNRKYFFCSIIIYIFMNWDGGFVSPRLWASIMLILLVASKQPGAARPVRISRTSPELRRATLA